VRGTRWRPGFTAPYNSDGNQLTQTNGDGDTTTYTYTPLDQVASSTDPMGNETTYTYDLDGNLATTTDPDSRVTTDGYNHDDELTSITYSDGVTPNVTYTYNGDGLRTAMTDGTGTTSYSYDGLDRLTSVTDGAGNTVSYGYNADNSIDSIEYPNSQTVTQGYNDDDQLASVSDWLGNTTSFTYDPDSNLQTTTFPTGTSDVDTNTYNHADELTGTTMAQGSTNLATLSYTVDPAGLITNEAQTGLPGSASTGYTYTPNEQLETAGSLDYAYDDAHNLTELDSSGTNTYAYNDDSELTSSPAGTYTYDTLGERTGLTPGTGTASTYSYDQNQDLTGVTAPAGSVTYAYNGDGQLESSTTGGTSTQLTWDDTPRSPNLLAAGGESYIYGPGGNAVEQIASDGTVQYLHQDQIGSTRLITDSTGAVAGTFTYNPYGALSGSTGTATSLLGYAGQYTDPTSGLEYNQARWYDPDSGQFMIVDPKIQTTWQAYAYANNNPVTNADPSGEIDLVPGDGGLQGAQNEQIGPGDTIVPAYQTEPLSSDDDADNKNRIVVTDKGRQHVHDNHMPDGTDAPIPDQSDVRQKGIFIDGVSVDGLASDAEETAPEPQRGGRAYRVVHASATVGYDFTTGEYTSTYTVVTNSDGTVRTIFPGLPSNYGS
jgi:RHS repeat-associated protein